jgi:prophage regulatory protein
LHDLAQRKCKVYAMTDTTTTPTRYIRPKEAAARTGYTVGHLWRMEREGQFPQRVRLGEKAVGYLESEVQQWLETRVRVGRSRIRA